MAVLWPTFGRRSASEKQGVDLLAPTNGEINFLWSFIQGSIVIPETWNSLLRSYGFCERHAWIHLSIEMSFRDEYLLGPTILYCELIDKALRFIDVPRSAGSRLLNRGLGGDGSCFLCVMNLRNASSGVSPQDRLDRGRSNEKLGDFGSHLESKWRSFVCPDCSGQESTENAATRCRRHVVSALNARNPVDIAVQRPMLRELRSRLMRYQQSFLVGGLKVSNRDRAALIAAVGWCSGWRPLLAQISRKAVKNV
jgi:hypothetical protein